MCLESPVTQAPQLVASGHPNPPIRRFTNHINPVRGQAIITRPPLTDVTCGFDRRPHAPPAWNPSGRTRYRRADYQELRQNRQRKGRVIRCQQPDAIQLAQAGLHPKPAYPSCAGAISRTPNEGRRSTRVLSLSRRHKGTKLDTVRMVLLAASLIAPNTPPKSMPARILLCLCALVRDSFYYKSAGVYIPTTIYLSRRHKGTKLLDTV